MVKLPTVSDLVQLGTEQLEALMALPETIVNLNKALINFAQTVSRLDELAKRMDRMTAPLEEPLAALGPRLAAIVPMLDDDLLAAIPSLLDSVNRNALPALEMFGQTQSQVASMASSMEGLLRIFEQSIGRLGDLPGAGLVNLFRPPDRSGRSAKPAVEAAKPAAPAKPSSRTTKGVEERGSWKG